MKSKFILLSAVILVGLTTLAATNKPAAQTTNMERVSGVEKKEVNSEKPGYQETNKAEW